MAETLDDLSAPLGQQPAPRRRFRLPFTLMQATAAGLGLVIAVFVGFALFNRDPLGGEPVVRVALPEVTAPKPTAKVVEQADPAPVSPSSAAKTASAEPIKPGPGQKVVTIIDGSSGARQSVLIGGDGKAVDAGKTDGDVKLPADAAPAIMSGIDKRLLEKSRYGMIPVVADGLKPFTAYAAGTPAERAAAARMPAVAIVVAGLGVGASKTADAIARLPGEVTLAFTPYGTDTGKLVERARAEHHEVLLQVPMEPFDYPDNDPGPQTLLTSQSPEQTLDRLTWHMSRFQGYVGLANFMGARFVATEASMKPLISEAAKRGLGYFDDGSSPRSVAAVLAAGAAMPFAKADLTIDTVPTAGEIDRALAKLEELAKQRGTAIGTASALPVTIERIDNWAKALASHGVLLVPLTTAMLKSKSGS